MALYNPKSSGSLTPKVALAGAAGARRKNPGLSVEKPISRGKRFAKFLCLFVFLGVRVVLARAHTNPNPIRLHTRCFNPSQLQWGRSQRTWTSDGSQDVLLIKKIYIYTHRNTETPLSSFLNHRVNVMIVCESIVPSIPFFSPPLSLFYSFR